MDITMDLSRIIKYSQKQQNSMIALINNNDRYKDRYYSANFIL